MKIWYYLFCIAIVILLIGLGWIGNETYHTYLNLHNYQRELNGIWLPYEFNNSIQADLFARQYDPGGDWICVNVRNMKYKEALDTCAHETGHEIWANYCEGNMTSCLLLLNN